MKTVQIYFSHKRYRQDQRLIFHKDAPAGYVRAVVISDCDVEHAKMRANPRVGECFVGAVAIE